MKKLEADRRDYKKGYHIHKDAREKMDEKNVYSRRLLLYYSIECGLKYLLMERWNIMQVKEIIGDQHKLDLLYSHELEQILKELGQQGMVRLRPYTTRHGDVVNLKKYHQACRYGIVGAKGQIEAEKQFENDLLTISNWINGVMR